MRQMESYDVLRLIEHGRICYISSENVKGKTLARYLKQHSVMEKKELFSRMKEIAGQLSLIHRCRGNPCYQYVNPYSIILAEDDRIYFLDMQAESNREQILFMQRRDIREYFLPPKERYYQHASKELDIYGLGKTFQYMLASTEITPCLSRREECRLQRMISKAMGTKGSCYQSVSELQKYIPREKEKEKKEKSENKRKRKRKMCITLIFAVVAGGYFLLQQRKGEADAVLKEQKHEDVRKVKVEKNTAEKHGKDTVGVQNGIRKEKNRDEEYLELALAYFLNVGDMEKSRKCLNELEDKTLADNLKVLIRGYEKQECPEDEEDYKKRLENLEKAFEKRSEVSEEKEKQEIQCLIRGYGILEDENSVEKVLGFVERGMQKEYLNDSVKKELLKYQAVACEKKEETEEAAKIYTEILQLETKTGDREELYKKIAQLYETAGRRDLSIDTCIQGIKELKESQELKLQHIRLMCSDAAVSREACGMQIKEYLETDEKILENEAFQKLQKEYEIKVEGEEVWVGR